MDNTTIKSIAISDFSKGYLSNDKMDGVTHIKTLPCISLVESLVGHYEVQVGEKYAKTEPGGFFIAPSQIKQTITHRAGASGKTKARWIFFNVEINGIYPLDMLYEFPVAVSGDTAKKLHGIMDEIFESENKFKLYSLVCDAVKLLTEIGCERREKNGEIIKACKYIWDNYKNKISVSELAKVLKCSESQLFSSFKRHFGTSPVNYANGYRLGKACILLESSEYNISEVAQSVGFEDPLYFSRLFSKKYGVSPSEYRKNIK